MNRSTNISTTSAVNSISTGVATTANVTIRFAKGFVSFFVGLSYFFIYKLMFQLLLLISGGIFGWGYSYKLSSIGKEMNMAFLESADSMIASIGSILIVVAIVMGVKASKKLNRRTDIKRPVLRRTIIIFIGFIAAIFTTAIVQIS